MTKPSQQSAAAQKPQPGTLTKDPAVTALTKISALLAPLTASQKGRVMAWLNDEHHPANKASVSQQDTGAGNADSGRIFAPKD